MDGVAIGVALARLARKSIDGWVMWKTIQLKNTEIRRAAERHYRNRLASSTIARWRIFVGQRVRRYRLYRRARHHHRSRMVRRAFGTWLCYLARLDKEYAALHRALQNRQRSNTRAALTSWQYFKAASQARRLQFLHAQGHREAVLSAEMVRRWLDSIAELRMMRSKLAVACEHANLQVQGFVLNAWTQAAQLSATLRWAKQSRLCTLRISLGTGKLRRAWHVWAVDFVATARAKAAQLRRAVTHLSTCRLRAAMAMLGSFLIQRRWVHRQWSTAVQQVRVSPSNSGHTITAAN